MLSPFCYATIKSLSFIIWNNSFIWQQETTIEKEIIQNKDVEEPESIQQKQTRVEQVIIDNNDEGKSNNNNNLYFIVII